MNRISIIGCGWLGLPLGRHLVREGYQVTGSTTSAGKMDLLRQAGIHPVLLKFSPEPQGNLQTLLEADVVIISIPPRAGQYGDAFHPQQIQFLAEALQGHANLHLLYISSTSVYPETNRELTETDEVIAEAPLIQAEHVLKQTGLPLTILRCGGLMGEQRIPGKYFIGKTVTTGNIPVNFVHQDDVIGIITQVLKQNVWNETFNVVAPEHPIRRDIYLKNAQDFGWQVPEFQETTNTQPFKIINSDKLITKLGYRFRYPNPLYFTYQPTP
ncbi:MAG: NAD(P)H-binding protein [Spirosomataceae bacterium]